VLDPGSKATNAERERRRRMATLWFTFDLSGGTGVGAPVVTASWR
jgi:hypothetical protein